MLTIGTTYYNNPTYLMRFVERNIEFVDEMIIVDDGSPDTITNYIEPSRKIRLFRVLKDYGFNSHGCRNLIMKKTSNDWNILMDIDRDFLSPKIAYEQIKQTKLFDDCLYRFMAHAGINDSHISVNDFLINRKHFFSAGGYDEEIKGQRWGDREYFKQLENFGREKVLYGVDMMLTRKPSIYIKQTSEFDIKKRKDYVELIENRIKNPDPKKPILTFEWEEIY